MKSIGLPPDQYAPALRSLAATFAATPVLAGSNRGDVALAQPKVVAGDWSWIQSAPPDWSTQPLTDATSQATLDYTPQRIVEGWLRLVPRKDEPR